MISTGMKEPVPSAILELADAIWPAARNLEHDAGGTAVESLTDAVMGVTAAIVPQLEPLENVAALLLQQNDILGRIANSLEAIASRQGGA